MKIPYCFILTVLLCLTPDNIKAKKLKKKRATINYLEVISSIPKVRLIFQDVLDLWNIVLRQSDLTKQHAFFQSVEHEIIGHFKMITSKLLDLEQEVYNIPDKTIDTILEAFPKILRLELSLHELRQIIHQINFADEQMRYYLILSDKNILVENSGTTWPDPKYFSTVHQNDSPKNDVNYIENMLNKTKRAVDSNQSNGVEKFTLKNFATWAVGHDYNSLQSLLRRMNDLVAPNDTVGIFKLIQETSQLQKMNIIIIFNILCAIVCAYGTSTTIIIPLRNNLRPSASMVDYIRHDITKFFNSMWEDLSKCPVDSNYTIFQKDIIRGFENVNMKIQQAQNTTSPFGLEVLNTLVPYIFLDGEIANVNKFYETFLAFQKDNFHNTSSPNAWIDLAKHFKENTDSGIFRSLEKIHKYTIENLYEKIKQEMQMNACVLRQSPYQTLCNLHNIIAITELKAYAMIQFSYMILRTYGEGDFTMEAQLAMSTQENYARQKITALQNILADTERSFYLCDPRQFVEEVSYTRLTNLMQGYIENEVNFNPDNTCSESCHYYSNTEVYGCYKNQFCSHQPKCRGRVLDCRYVQADMTVCTSQNPTRRYDWVEYKNGLVLGNKGQCEKKNKYDVRSWWRYLVLHCSYCLCLCDDATWGSDRFFNLRDVTSDLDKNKVVTGVRIKKQNNIIHLQIQQGVLSPRGVIEKNTSSWKPVEDYSIGDSYVRNGVDYHTLNWSNRGLDLDELIGPSEHVVTGVRFRLIGSHLNLEVRVTPIKFATGEVLSASQSYWLGNDNTPVSSNPRSEIELIEPGIPVKKGPHFLKSRPNQYIQFQPTSFKSDLAQTTVPFLDSQELESHGFPLSGIGLIYRGAPGSGGFIAPKLITYEYGPHIYFD